MPYRLQPGNFRCNDLAVILTKRPYMSIGRLMGEVGWQDRVHKQVKRMMKEKRKSKS
jgi:hypothetical protein